MERSEYCDICRVRTHCGKVDGAADMGILRPNCYVSGEEKRTIQVISFLKNDSDND